MSNFKKKLAAITFALFTLTLIMLPLFCTAIHQSKLVDEGSVSIVENGELFITPQECWMLTPMGITVSCLFFVVLLSTIFVFSRVFSDFPLLLWIAILVGGTLLIQFTGRSTFREHKDDHVLIAKNKIEFKYEGHLTSIRLSDIKHVIHEDRGFYIVHKDYGHNKIRISDVKVSKLCGSELLKKRLQELVIKFPKKKS